MLARLTSLTTRHRDGLVSVAVRVVAAIAGFAVTVLIGREFGPAANGIYGLVTQTAMMVSILVVGGMDFVVVRRFAAALATGRHVPPATVLRVIAAVVVPAAIVGCALLLLFLAVADRGTWHSLSLQAVATLGILIASRAATRLTSAILRAYGRVFLSQLVEVLFIPLALLLGFAAGQMISLDAVLLLTSVAALCAALIGVVPSLWLARKPRPDAVEAEPEAFAWRAMMREGWPLGAAAVALGFAEWYGLAIVAAFGGADDAGLYRVAAQIAATIGIVTTGLTSAQAAAISAAHAVGDRERLGQVLRNASVLSTALAAVIAIAMCAGGTQLLALVGPEFVPAFLVLLLLGSAQLAALVISVAGLALAMTGHSKVHFPVTVSASLFLLVAAPAAASFAGATGVAVAVALAQLGRVVAYFLIARSRLGINVITGRPIIRAGG